MWRLRGGVARLKHAIRHRRRNRSHGLLNMSEGVVVLHVRQDVMRRERFLSSMTWHILVVIFIFILIASTTFVLEVYRPFMFMWLAILLIIVSV